MPKKFETDEQRKQYKREQMARLRAQKKESSESSEGSQMQALAQFPPDVFERIIHHYQRWQRAINRCHREMFVKRM